MEFSYDGVTFYFQEEYEDILEDIREECGKFGEVKFFPYKINFFLSFFLLIDIGNTSVDRFLSS